MCSILAMERLVKLRDKQWSKIEGLLPSGTRTGGRNAKPHRPMVKALLWVLRTGAPGRFRRLAMRFEKLADSFLAFLHLGCTLVWLR